MDYKSSITALGPLVEELAAEGDFLIVFNDNAPAALAEMSVLHTKCTLDKDVNVGDLVIFGSNTYIVSAVGEEANHTLRSMGHCSFKFSGKNEAELPGQIELSGGTLPIVKPGDHFEIMFT